jgi:hypothetical protein
MMQSVITLRPLGSLQKNPGDSFGATLTFQHRGQAQQVWVGIGLAYGKSSSLTGIPLLDLIDNLGHHPPFCFAAKQVSLTADTEFSAYTVDVDDTIPQDVSSGQPLDAQKFISKTQPAAGQVAPDDFGVNNWDDDVFTAPSAVLDWSSMMGMLLMVMMMSMFMPMLEEEKPPEKEAAPATAGAAAGETKSGPTAAAPPPESGAEGVAITVHE